MASINTKSTGEEIAKVDQDIERLSAAGKVSDESRMLLNTLVMIVNVLVAMFLEEKTKKGSKNSIIPPSQTGEDVSNKPRKPSDKRP